MNEQGGLYHVEIAGLVVTPKSPEASRICQEDLTEVITAFVQDKAAATRGLFDKEVVPQELTQIRMGRIVRDRYPELSADDQEAVRQQAVALLNLTQRAKQLASEGGDVVIGGVISGGGGAEDRVNTALIDGVRRIAMDVRDLDIDLIDSINPFAAAYSVLAKAMDADVLKQVHAVISARRTTLTPEDARALATAAVRFKRERG